MTALIEIDTEDFLTGEDGCITGIARVQIETAQFMDADIGGFDGPGVESATLIDVRIGGLTLTAEQIATAIGVAPVVKFEEWVARDYYDRELAA